MEDHASGKNRDGESDGRLQPKLLLMSGKITEKVSYCFLSYALPKRYDSILKEQIKMLEKLLYLKSSFAKTEGILKMNKLISLNDIYLRAQLKKT